MKNKIIEKIENIFKKSAEEKWPFPKTFEALKSAGVESYKVIFDNEFDAFYKGKFGYFKRPMLPGYYPLKTADKFSEEKIRGVIKQHLKEQTPYLNFLEEAVKCGVSHYTVDMLNQTVTYYNPDESKFYQEHVPNI